MREYIQKVIADICKSRFKLDVWPELDRPDEKFGDFTTNVAMHLAKTLKSDPKKIADVISEEFTRKKQSNNAKDDSPLNSIVKIESINPGFVNFTLSDAALIKLAQSKPEANKQLNQEVIIEFGDPNPFKEMHLGHLYSTIIGDSIARLIQANGASVHRVSYHGDVGMHVAKAIYGIGEYIDWDVKRLKELEETDNNSSVGYKLGELYAKGAKAFSDDQEAATKIRSINKQIYARTDPAINEVYDWGLKVSFIYFNSIFDMLGVNYEKHYLESQTVSIGLTAVQENIGNIFEKSQGAVVYHDKDGLNVHTRVFINSEGLPTYETKDLGLAELKDKDFPGSTKSIIITAQEQTAYFKVILAVLKKLRPDLAAKTMHISHGFLSLSSGKMSSRTGNVHSAQTLLDDVQTAVKNLFPDSMASIDIFMAALKYTFLKNRIGNDMVFDVKSSVALEGNSGPYLQYSYARAHGIKRKLNETSVNNALITNLTPDERNLVRKIGEYSEIVNLATDTLMPHHICNYLYELAQSFNRFYEHNTVIGDKRQDVRSQLINYYVSTLSAGLQLLSIPTPESL